MAVVASAGRSATAGTRSRGGAGLALALALALLAASLPAPVRIVLAADASAADQPAPLDQLSTTIGEIKLSLSAMRRDLEAMRTTPDASAPPTKAADERAVAAHEVAQLRSERAALKSRIAELEKVVKQARTSEVVAALVKRSSASPIETAAAAEIDAAPRSGPVLKASEPAGSRGAVAADAPASADGGAALQLRAELALAQLRITDLTEELESTRANQAALEAEVRSLRSLTDAKIKRFMGWQ
jgi:chromosome segregation ATPase